MNKREVEHAISDEVAEWPGVELEFTHGGSHPKAKLSFEGKSLFRAFGGNQMITAYPHKAIADMRATMTQLGAARKAEPPSKEEVDKRHRQRNEAGVAARPDPVRREFAQVKPDLADQLVAKGVASPEQRTAIQVERAPATYERRAVVEAIVDEDREAALAAFKARVDAIVDGIYFDLPDEIYHAVNALGSGSIKELNVSAGTFWRGSWLDPDRPELDEDATKAQIIGKAYHIARLEPDRFEQLYVRKPSKADYPAKGLITSDEKVKAALKEAGEQQTVSGETTAQRAERLLDTGYEGVILPLELARWEETVAGRIPLPADVWDDIQIDMARLHGVEEIAALLTGGFAEVSIFWTDRHGIRCKARLDYLAFKRWVDFKTFANPNGKVLPQAIADAFRFNGYYLQAAHYRHGVEAMRTGGLQIIGEATDAQRALVAAIQIDPYELECWYVFQEKGGIPNLLARRFEFSAVGISELSQMAGLKGERLEHAMAAMSRPTEVHKLALRHIEEAKKTFVLYSQVYEPGEPWAPIEPMGTIGDLDFNSYWLEGKQ